MELTRHLVFPPFALDTVDERLRRGEQVLPLRRKTFALLRYLVAHPGQLVTKEELLNAVWLDAYVSEGVLTECMRELRRALGDKPRTPQFIQTAHGRGYRWIAETRSGGLEARPSSPRVSSAKSQAPHIVGREGEVAQLHGWLGKALSGERQVVFITGEPGIGKTTVVEAFLEQLATAGGLWIGRGQCVEHYGAGEAYLPVLEALGRLCREADGEQCIALLRQRAPTWLVQMPALFSEAEREQLQRQVQGATRERMLREMAEAVEALTREHPFVLWIEDLQWSDHSTLDLIAYLARRPESAQLLVLGTYRPVDVLVREHPLKVVKQELQLHEHCEELQLGFLNETAVEEYLARRFVDSDLPAELTRLVHQHTEGNPLFMVNVVNHLVAQGMIAQQDGRWRLVGEIGQVEVPSGIQQFIEQQIERVSPDELQVLEAASVVGMDFSAAAVAAAVEEEIEVVEKRSDDLARHEQFLRADGVSEWPDGIVAAHYSFTHSLYQEVLYDRITVGRRINLHQRIGERQEQAYGHRAREVATELAVHFERGRDAQRAVQYLQQAGENARQRSAYQEAIAQLTKGLELLRTLPDTPDRSQHELRLQIALGMPLIATKGYASPAARQAYARARELCQQLGDAPQLFPILFSLFFVNLVTGEIKTAHGLADQLLRLAHRQPTPTFLLPAHTAFGAASCYLGEPAAAREHSEQGIALYDPEKHNPHVSGVAQDPGVMCRSHAALALWFLGYPDQALKRIQEALTLARELAHPFSLAFTLYHAAILHQLFREGQAAQERVEAAIALSTEQGFPLLLAGGTIMRGWALAEQAYLSGRWGQREEGIA